MIASYVEEVGHRTNWISVRPADAKRHELYYDHPPLRTWVIVVLCIAALEVILGAGRELWPGSTVLATIRVLAAFVFGAAFAPAGALPATGLSANLSGMLLLVPLLYAYGGRWLRIVITAITGYYFYQSLQIVDENIAAWNALPFMQDFFYWRGLAINSGLGPLARWYANYETGGLYGLGEQVYAILEQLSAFAILGFSASLWLRMFFRLNYYIWFSEAGHLFFEKRIRKPQI